MEYLVASVTERSVAEPPKVKTETVVRVTRRRARGERKIQVLLLIYFKVI